jgi:CrcB protein
VTRLLGLALATALGSGLGAVARFLLALGLTGDGLPWATLLANVAGSFLIGLAAEQSTRPGHVMADPFVRQFVMVGFCGGFTTFSLFSLEALLLVRAGVFELAALYVALSLALWLAGAWAGMTLGRRLVPGPLPEDRPAR